MARVAVIGEDLRISGYALAGAVTCLAADRPSAVRAWQELPRDVAVVVLTPSVAGWLAADLAQRPEVLHVVLPQAPEGSVLP